MTQLTYIAGYGRSATTTADLVEAVRRNAISCGELWRLPHLIPIDLCSCGVSIAACPVWSGQAQRSSRLQLLWFQVLESATTLFVPMPLVHRAVRLELGGGESYQQYWSQAFGAASGASGTSAFVDSSKSTRRTAGRPIALHASGIDIVDLIVTHRPFRDIVQSRRNAFSRSGRHPRAIAFRTRIAQAVAIGCARLISYRLPVQLRVAISRTFSKIIAH